MTRMIEIRTFDEIAIGDKASMVRMLHEGDVETWAAVTGNVNLIDLDPGPRTLSMFAHGGGQVMWAASLFSTLAGTELRGSVAHHHRRDAFHRPVGVEIPVTVKITVVEKREDTNSVVFDCKAVDPDRRAAGRRQHHRDPGASRQAELYLARGAQRTTRLSSRPVRRFE